MALDFAANAAARVNFGTNTVLDDLPVAGPFSVFAWVYRTANGNNQEIALKAATGTSNTGWAFLISTGAGEGCFRLIVFRPTLTDSQTATAWNAALNTWTFLAGTFDGTKAYLYKGDLSTVVAEATYNSQSTGAGTVTSDASGDLIVGNNSGGTLGFKGYIAQVGIANRQLSVNELRLVQYSRLAAKNISGIVLLTDLHDSSRTQPDFSGNKNNGTVTLAANAPHVPARMPFGMFQSRVPVFIAQPSVLDSTTPLPLSGAVTFNAFAGVDSVQAIRLGGTLSFGPLATLDSTQGLPVGGSVDFTTPIVRLLDSVAQVLVRASFDQYLLTHQYPPPYYQGSRFGVERFNPSKRLMERLGPDSGEPREKEPPIPTPPKWTGV